MNKKLPRWEHEGWTGVPHRDVLRCLAAELKARKAPTTFKLAAPGSPDRALCRQANLLAKRAAKNPTDTLWVLTLPQDTALPGLSLQGNRQRVFYQSIREEKTRVLAPRPSTIKMLEVVRRDVENTFGLHVSDADIWRSVQAKDILPRTSQFLWKGLHNAHRIGNYWTNIPECEDRAVCKDCDEIEDLEHILIGCQSPGREIIWKAAETLWLERESDWPTVSLGTILGCGLAEFRDDKGKPKRGTQRLYRILMSESAYMIWRLRNDRVISRDGEPATTDEIMNKWKFVINQRLQVDRTLASRPKMGKRPALAPQLVLATWSNTLDDEYSLPADWLREPRVLVGSRAFPQTPPRRPNSRGIG
jgi:ribonuclease HI